MRGESWTEGKAGPAGMKLSDSPIVRVGAWEASTLSRAPRA